MKHNCFCGQLSQDAALLDRTLRVSESFDLIARNAQVGGRNARFYWIDGFVKDEVMEKILEYLFTLSPEELSVLPGPEALADRCVPYTESAVVTDPRETAIQILSGTTALLVDGFCGAVMIDARTYPVRGVSEPDDDRVLRGPRDGFVETLICNTALLRRRLRDPALTMHYLRAADDSHTDVVLCYFDGTANPETVRQLETRITSIRAKTLVMSQESLAECLIKKQWWNPFPRIRYTERPDTAAAHVAEGKIIVLIDNSPSVMILPTSIFDFTQDTNDFSFPPLVGTYLRTVRMLLFLATLFLTPLWFLFIQNPQWIPQWLDFIRIREPNAVPVILQLLLVEFVLDGLKIASLNTPSSLSSSFSVVSALILGDFAIQSGWVVPEVVLYMAFVAIGSFTQPSFELGYAFKLSRLVLLVLTALFNLWGFLGALALILLTVATTRSITGHSYLYPLIPFNARALRNLLFRSPISRKNT